MAELPDNAELKVPTKWGTRLSILIPLFNEAGMVRLLYGRVRAVLARLPGPCEMIFVDDGSTDETFRELLALHEENAMGVKVLRLARNFGHQVAISAGLARAGGDTVAVMDGDLQDPPELIPAMLVKLEEGYDVVYGIRASRQEGWLKQAAYHAFYRLLYCVAKIQIPLDAGDFCVMRRRVVTAMNNLPERNRFVRGLRRWVGFRPGGIPYAREARASGIAKYTWGKLLRLSFDGRVSFSDAPLRLASWLGFIVSLGSFIGIGMVLYYRFFTFKPVPGFASLAILVLFLGGVQLVAVGVVGEYLGRIFDEVKQRPLYVVSDQVGWGKEPQDADAIESAAHPLSDDR